MFLYIVWQTPLSGVPSCQGTECSSERWVCEHIISHSVVALLSCKGCTESPVITCIALSTVEAGIARRSEHTATATPAPPMEWTAVRLCQSPRVAGTWHRIWLPVTEAGLCSVPARHQQQHVPCAALQSCMDLGHLRNRPASHAGSFLQETEPGTARQFSLSGRFSRPWPCTESGISLSTLSWLVSGRVSPAWYRHDWDVLTMVHKARTPTTERCNT